MSETPVLELPEAPSFMVVDGQTFLVEKLSQSPTELLQNVHAFYKENLESLKERVANHISLASQDDLDTQVKRIERHLKTGVVMLPDALKTSGSLMMLQNNRVYATRIVLFRPTRISCTLQQVARWVLWIKDDITKRDAERFANFYNWANTLLAHYEVLKVGLASVKVDITINQDLVIEPMVVSYCPELKHIYAQPPNKHCHVHSGSNELCTGSSTAVDFWNDPGFELNFNSINPHSFANSGTPAANKIKDMLRNQYFVEAHVRGSEASAWKI